MNASRFAFALLLCLPCSIPAGAADVAACEAELQVAMEQYQQQFVQDCESDDSCSLEVPSLKNRCPALARELAADPWSSLLARSEESRTTGDVYALDELRLFYLTAPRRAAPGQDALERALASLDEEPADRKPSLRDQFWAWFSETFLPENVALPEWLEDFSVDEDTLSALFVATLVLLVLLAVAVIANEVRHSYRGRQGEQAGRWSVDLPGLGPELTLADVDALPLREQPAALLRIVLTDLARRGVLETSVSATHRELLRHASVLQQGEQLGHLCLAAERCAFAEWNPRPEDVADLQLLAGSLLAGAR